MPSLTLPDVNVWLALLLEDHVKRPAAAAWWESDRFETAGFTRLTQHGVLRLLTTAAAMNQRPLTMRAAWKAYDRLFADDRVVFLAEPAGVEDAFRKLSRAESASPNSWADAWLLAFAQYSGADLVTFDRALAQRSSRAILLS